MTPSARRIVAAISMTEAVCESSTDNFMTFCVSFWYRVQIESVLPVSFDCLLVRSERNHHSSVHIHQHHQLNADDCDVVTRGTLDKPPPPSPAVVATTTAAYCAFCAPPSLTDRRVYSHMLLEDRLRQPFHSYRSPYTWGSRENKARNFSQAISA